MNSPLLPDPDAFDVVVIGAGFGGLAAALTAAEAGARVALFERLTYPGGCASTFSRRRHQFESGATLFSGFDPGQLFHGWITRHAMDVRFEAIDPMVELRAPNLTLPIGRSREALVSRFCAMPGAPVRGVVDFFHNQQRVADALWALFNEPELLPPFGLRELLTHAGRLGSYASLPGLVGQPLDKIVHRWGAGGFEPLRIYLDAVCQITVQASSARAEAPFALGAMDYFFRGTGHVHGGIGQLAWAMIDTLKKLGVQIFLADEARAITRADGRWTVRSRRREVRSERVIANLLPQDLARIADLTDHAHLNALSARVREGWGAAMLYVTLSPDAAMRPEAHHLELVDDPSAPFVEGNHVFCSISGLDERERSPDGARTVTSSTHIPMAKLLAMDEASRGAYIATVQARMRQTINARAPELWAAKQSEMTASPRTFARFTGRHEGFVGGIPRVAGLHNYKGMLPTPIAPGLYMVGDTVFPGQSTLAVALGGIKVARAAMR